MSYAQLHGSPYCHCKLEVLEKKSEVWVLVRRNNLDICSDILRVARGGANKTRIVYQANLNFQIVKKYLNRLVDGGLLRPSENMFITTPKGVQFIEQYTAISRTNFYNATP